MKHPRGSRFVHDFHTFIQSFGLAFLAFLLFFFFYFFWLVFFQFGLFFLLRKTKLFITLQMYMIFCGFSIDNILSEASLEKLWNVIKASVVAYAGSKLLNIHLKKWSTQFEFDIFLRKNGRKQQQNWRELAKFIRK